ncbi:hypothetical protein [Ruegeria sp. ANG-S4]|uniref:hypothetical protein n=1 Tax=Ruegeria sp. ANG-S4 TaxID=1577904 RepID=UPI000ABB565B|nr:hypothetical protein [Ruegeria sp. ANG-S4]
MESRFDLILAGLPVCVGLALSGAFTTVLELEDYSTSGLLFALFTALVLALSAPLFLPLFFVIVPWVALIPIIAVLASSVAVRVQNQPKKIHFAIWLIAWIAVFAATVSTGKISA